VEITCAIIKGINNFHFMHAIIKLMSFLSTFMRHHCSVDDDGGKIYAENEYLSKMK
jgi:hypothetical protein